MSVPKEGATCASSSASGQAPTPPLGSRQYVELKTSALLTQRRQHSFERYKLPKFWAQSFLLNVPTVVVGFRTEDGEVQKLQSFKTLEIPKLVRGKNLWASPPPPSPPDAACARVHAHVLRRSVRARGLHTHATSPLPLPRGVPVDASSGSDTPSTTSSGALFSKTDHADSRGRRMRQRASPSSTSS